MTPRALARALGPYVGHNDEIRDWGVVEKLIARED